MYTGDVDLVGRLVELRALEDLLERAAGGSGGLLVVTGPAGSGRTALADAAVELARGRGLQVVRAAPARGQPGRLVWAQLLDEVVPAKPPLACWPTVLGCCSWTGRPAGSRLGPVGWWSMTSTTEAPRRSSSWRCWLPA